MLAAIMARQHEVITILKPARPSDRCGRITAAKTGGSGGSTGSDDALLLSMAKI